MRVCTIERRRPATDGPGPGGTPHDQEDRMTQTTTEFLTADELAAMLNVPVRTVRRCWRGWGRRGAPRPRRGPSRRAPPPPPAGGERGGGWSLPPRPFSPPPPWPSSRPSSPPRGRGRGPPGRPPEAFSSPEDGADADLGR